MDRVKASKLLTNLLYINNYFIMPFFLIFYMLTQEPTRLTILIFIMLYANLMYNMRVIKYSSDEKLRLWFKGYRYRNFIFYGALFVIGMVAIEFNLVGGYLAFTPLAAFIITKMFRKTSIRNYPESTLLVFSPLILLALTTFCLFGKFDYSLNYFIVIVLWVNMNFGLWDTSLKRIGFI